ncbi:MAG: alpha/beta hydrolase fold domain-containing protein [Eubacteriales bacterium]|nr:alpha/beta hydrolase fold domain-containing protein [Eubacteriales bacterium]
MGLPAKMVRAQLGILKPLICGCSLEASRKGQDKLGELMEAHHRREVLVKVHPFETFQGAWITPMDERRQGVLLYLHGGGYTCGDLEYAKGFASTLAVRCGLRVFCAAYRLAPEHRYPAALDDALTAYRYLLDKGYGRIVLCGESAGGGLCYSLCLRLKELGLPLPAGVIAISPWTDLTASGDSYETNRNIDPTMTASLLGFYAQCYAGDLRDPLVSPLFGELQGLPPSLFFVGGDEIMLDDTRMLHEKLLKAGCRSQMIVAPERWHAYVLYDLNENQGDFDTVNGFLDKFLGPQRKLKWMRLDNAAKIYPAALRRSWSNIFRLSADLVEDIDPQVMQSALDVTVRRFPSMAVRLRRGVFWYYLEQVPQAPALRPESSYPLTRMTLEEIRRCALRVIVYKKRVAVEFFHAITDGNGGLIFLKTLLAEYLLQKYRVAVPPELGVLGRLEAPSADEFEDSFLKYAGDISASRAEANAWRLSGTPEPEGVLDLTCFRISAAEVLEKAHARQVSLTEYLCAVMLQALQTLQREKVPFRRRRRALKVLIPVDLRRLFPSRTLRNFALYSSPGIDPKLGDYTLEEICAIVHHKLGYDVNPKQMSARIATNVNSERSLILKIMPLFVKNVAMKAVFDAVGERKSCLSLSNLGRVQVPEAMEGYVTRFDFIIGPQAKAPHNCGVLSYGGMLSINFIRNIREPELERAFYAVLREEGLCPEVQSSSQC